MAVKVDATAIHAALKAEILHGGARNPAPPSARWAWPSASGSPAPRCARRWGDCSRRACLSAASAGCRCADSSPEELMQVYDLRILLEGQASPRGGKPARTEMDLVRLDALLARDRELQDPDNAPRG